MMKSTKRHDLHDVRVSVDQVHSDLWAGKNFFTSRPLIEVPSPVRHGSPDLHKGIMTIVLDTEDPI